MISYIFSEVFGGLMTGLVIYNIPKKHIFVSIFEFMLIAYPLPPVSNRVKASKYSCYFCISVQNIKVHCIIKLPNFPSATFPQRKLNENHIP